jgi:DNA invertase Pin-like site-specific DNA recombinase
LTGERSGKFVAYYRVSTERQGRSGLGLEAQQRAIREHLDGGRWRIVAEITEIESGKCTDRPKLAEAFKLCRLHNATLIIAKLDRLARNVAFVWAADLAPVIKEIQAAGTTSLRGIAAALNERGIPTASGDGEWQAMQVARVLARL